MQGYERLNDSPLEIQTTVEYEGKTYDCLPRVIFDGTLYEINDFMRCNEHWWGDLYPSWIQGVWAHGCVYLHFNDKNHITLYKRA